MPYRSPTLPCVTSRLQDPPGPVRGRVDLIINGSYWVGTAAGAAATLV